MHVGRVSSFPRYCLSDGSENRRSHESSERRHLFVRGYDDMLLLVLVLATVLQDRVGDEQVLVYVVVASTALLALTITVAAAQMECIPTR